MNPNEDVDAADPDEFDAVVETPLVTPPVEPVTPPVAPEAVALSTAASDTGYESGMTVSVDQGPKGGLVENIGTPDDLDEPAAYDVVKNPGDRNSTLVWLNRSWPHIAGCCRDCLREVAAKWITAGKALPLGAEDLKDEPRDGDPEG